MKRTILLAIIFCFFTCVVNGQKSAGWKTYLNGTRIDNIADAGDYLWASSGFTEVIKFDKNTKDVVFYSLDSTEMGPDYLIQSIACGKNGLPWIGVYDTGVLKMNEDEKWILLPLIGEYEPVSVSDILITENDIVWSFIGVRASTGGIDQILVRYQGNAIDVFKPDDHIYPSSCPEDKDGNLWFGKAGGMVKFDSENWTSYNSPTQWEPKPNLFRNIIIDESDNIWVVGRFGFFSLDNKWIKFNGTDWQVNDFPISEMYINSLALQDDSIIWLGTSKGLLKFSNSQWTIYNTENTELTNNSVFSMVIDDDGTKWLGTENGLVAFNENWVTTSTSVESKMMNEIELFPNPANDFLTLKMPDGIQKSMVDILNIQGKVIKSFSLNQNQNRLDVSQFPAGLYLVRLQSNENYFMKKFVKN